MAILNQDLVDEIGGHFRHCFWKKMANFNI